MLDADVKRLAMQGVLGGALPKQGDRDYRCLAADHDDEQASMSVSAAGLWFCHSCGRGGDVVDLARAINGGTPEPFAITARRVRSLAAEGAKFDDDAAAVPPPETGPLSELRARVHAEATAIEHVTERQLSVEGVLGWSLVETTPPAILFPLRDGAATIRVRRLLEGVERYKISGKPPNGLPLFLTFDVATPPRLVVLTEGIFDAIAATEVGLPAASLPNGAEITKRARRAITALARAVPHIVLATDGDEAGDRAAETIAEMLIDEPVNLYRLAYPPGVKDLNELLQADPDMIPVLVDMARPFCAPSHPASWTDGPDWMSLPPPTTAWLIEGLLRPGERVFFIGVGESYKTTLARAVSVAAVRPAGIVTPVGPYRVLGGYRVLMINEELPAADARAYLIRFAKGMGVSSDDLQRIVLSHQAGFALDEPKWLERMRRVLSSKGPPWLIVIDSFRHVLGRVDENSGSSVMALLRALDRELRATGATLVVIAHESKSKTSEKLVMAGSTAPQGWADVQLRFVRKRREPARVTVSKGRNLAGIPAMVEIDIEKVGPGDGLRLRAAPLEKMRVATPGPRLGALARQIRSGLEAKPGSYTKNQLRGLISRPNQKYPAMDGALQELLGAAIVEQTNGPRGSLWSLKSTGVSGSSV